MSAKSLYIERESKAIHLSILISANDNLKKSEWNSKNNGDNSLDSENALCRSDSLDAEMIVKDVPHGNF